MHFLSRLSLALLLSSPLAALAQTGGVRVGTPGTPAPSAVLDLSPDAATAPKGFLPPRLSTAQRDAIGSPAAGLTIFNTTTNALNVWNGAGWVAYLADTTPVTLPPVAFAYIGAVQTYTVPAGISWLDVDMAGAGGGSASYQGPPGLGGRVQARLSVMPGQVLAIYVGGSGGNGGAGAGGYNGGGSGFAGGGGATDLRLGGTALANRVLVAGGGGGTANVGGANPPGGGCGGGLTACTGGAPVYGTGGAGGGQAGGSATGGNVVDGTGYGGGGGGGYSGGGGGNNGGGGGGSSFAGAGTSSVVHTQGFQSVNGYLRLTPYAGTTATPTPAPVLDASNFVNLPPGDNLGNHTATRDLDLTGNKVLNAGQVGIGTGSPALPLDVAGAGAAVGLRNAAAWDHLYFTHDGGTAFVNAGGADTGLSLRVGTGSTGTYGDAAQNYREVLRLLPNGRVGVGTATPTAALDVVGNVRASGNFDMGLQTSFTDYVVAASSVAYISATCPPGTRLLSGGGGLLSASTSNYANFTILYNGPDENNPTSVWSLKVANTGSTIRELRVYCTCGRAQ